MEYVVSACLAGQCCRYNAESSALSWIVHMVEQGEALPLCPEVLGGLSVPREPCEIKAGRVLTPEGLDCTNAFVLGASRALCLAQEHGCRAAILKTRSPSCGCGMIYDGFFRRRLIPGNGLFAALLLREGFTLFSDESPPPFLSL